MNPTIEEIAYLRQHGRLTTDTSTSDDRVDTAGKKIQDGKEQKSETQRFIEELSKRNS